MVKLEHYGVCVHRMLNPHRTAVSYMFDISHIPLKANYVKIIVIKYGKNVKLVKIVIIGSFFFFLHIYFTKKIYIYQ